MGKVSSKNNRRSRHKTRQAVRTDPTKGRFTSSLVAARWNAKRTVKQNIAALGFAADVNTEASFTAARGARINAVDAAAMLDIVDDVAPAPAAGSLALANPRAVPHAMKDDEVAYLRVRLRGAPRGEEREGGSAPPLSPPCGANPLRSPPPHFSASRRRTRATLSRWRAT